MKKTTVKLISIILMLCLALSFSSCSLFATMREYSRKASELTIIPTPEDEALYAEFNTALVKSLGEAVKLGVSTGYNVKNTKITNEAENAKILDKASGTLNKLILSNDPGKESRDIEPVSAAGTLLESFDAASSLSYTTSRSTVNETVTNEKGEEVTDESGAVVREPKIKDNFMDVAFLFYNDEIVEEAYTDEDGMDVAAVTERNYAGADAIEQVFGQPADKQAVLAQFDAIRDYLRVNDYSFEYTDCKVSADIDLDTDRISGVSFEKTMAVTALVTGVGVFEDYGELTVTFNVIKTDSYSFTYAEAES